MIDDLLVQELLNIPEFLRREPLSEAEVKAQKEKEATQAINDRAKKKRRAKSYEQAQEKFIASMEQKYGKRYIDIWIPRCNKDGVPLHHYKQMNLHMTFVKEARKWVKLVIVTRENDKPYTNTLGETERGRGKFNSKVMKIKTKRLLKSVWEPIKKKHEQYLKRNDPNAIAKKKYKRSS